MKCECDQKTQVKYKYTLTVHAISGTVGDDGWIDTSDSDNWPATGTIKANFLSKGGREYINGQKVQAEVSHVAKTPSTSFSRSISPANHITFDSRTFEIVAAYDMDEVQKEVWLHLKEKVS